VQTFLDHMCIIVMGRLTLVLNRKARTLSILTKSQTVRFDLIDDKQLNGYVWPFFLIHENIGVLPLSAKIGENRRFIFSKYRIFVAKPKWLMCIYIWLVWIC
jgi:hypothetical protein